MKCKTALLSVFLILVFVKCNAQSITVSDILSNSDQYIEMEYFIDGKIRILNQAAKDRFFGKDYKVLIDKKGVVDAPNLLAALNYMYNIGYEVVLNYFNESGSTNRYLLKKVEKNNKELLPFKL
jgi:hypothetical protein